MDKRLFKALYPLTWPLVPPSPWIPAPVAEIELLIGATRLELTKLTGFGAASPLLLAVPLPKAVDPGAAEAAKFSRKTGQLRVRLRVAR